MLYVDGIGMDGWDGYHRSIPGICQFWCTITLSRPDQSAPESANLAKILRCLCEKYTTAGCDGCDQYQLSMGQRSSKNIFGANNNANYDNDKKVNCSHV